MTKEKVIPQIRFSGFTDTWEQREVSNVAMISTGGTPSTAINEYWNPKQVPWLSSGEVHKKYITYTDDKISNEGLNHSSARMIKQNSVLIALAGQGKTRGTVAINRISLSTNQSIAAMTFAPDICPEFVFSNLESRYDELRKVSSGDGTRGGLNKQLVSEIQIPYTSLNEQRKIGQFFTHLDRLITLHQRKYDKLTKVKKAMLEKMFPKNGSLYPEIRFKGFTDAWEQREFSELYEKNIEKNSELIGYDKTISIATMTYKDEGNGASDNSLSAYKVLRIGDIAFEGHTSKEFRYGRFVANDIGIGLMSPRFSTLRPIKEMPIDFWKYYIHYEPIMKYILVNATKAGTMMNEMVIPEFLEQSILVPSLKEQAKIGQYFTHLDRLITLHQRM
ncbi:restriction endonuclease subunit S [Ruminococcus sp. AF25-19]|jgi:type I restriction enzyme S subunit|nr:restriction endonuclease subunit S [Ruminococcus sp. AF25-19]